MFGSIPRFGNKKWFGQYKPVRGYHDEFGSFDTRDSQNGETVEPVFVGSRRYRAGRIISMMVAVILIYLSGLFTRLAVEKDLLSPILQKLRLDLASRTMFPVVPPNLVKISQKRVFFNNHTFDVDKDDMESEGAWNAYFSRFISLDDDVVERAGLPPSTRAQGRQVYSVAAYHQLHCVHVIRYGWGRLKEYGPMVLDDPYPGLEALTEGYSIEGHVSHCLDMIRQALECHADPTLEPMMHDDGITAGGNLASGWGGTPHFCRDFAAFTAWIDSPEQHPLPSVEAFVDTASSGSLHEHHHHNHEHGASE